MSEANEQERSAQAEECTRALRSCERTGPMQTAPRKGPRRKVLYDMTRTLGGAPGRAILRKSCVAWGCAHGGDVT